MVYTGHGKNTGEKESLKRSAGTTTAARDIFITAHLIMLDTGDAKLPHFLVFAYGGLGESPLPYK